MNSEAFVKPAFKNFATPKKKKKKSQNKFNFSLTFVQSDDISSIIR